MVSTVSSAGSEPEECCRLSHLGAWLRRAAFAVPLARLGGRRHGRARSVCPALEAGAAPCWGLDDLCGPVSPLPRRLTSSQDSSSGAKRNFGILADFPSEMKAVGLSAEHLRTESFLIHVNKETEAQGCLTYFASEEYCICSYGLDLEAEYTKFGVEREE